MFEFLKRLRFGFHEVDADVDLKWFLFAVGTGIAFVAAPLSFKMLLLWLT